MHVIKNIIRYPIKGLSEEYLENIVLKKNQVLPGDREFALARYNVEYNDSNPKHLRKTNFLALVKEEKLATLKSTFNPNTKHLLIKLGEKIVIDQYIKDKKSIEKVETFFQEYLNLPINEKPNLVQGIPVKENGGLTHSFSDIPDKAVSIVNLNTVKALEEKIGKSINSLRFRGNFLIEDGNPWEEFNWIGKKIHIGGCVLEVFKKTQRCAATIVNPVNGERDINIPKEINTHFGHIDLGVYAKVIKGGKVSILDKLLL
mgnify:FL=1